MLDAIGTLLEAIAVCALVFSGGGLAVYWLVTAFDWVLEWFA